VFFIFGCPIHEIGKQLLVGGHSFTTLSGSFNHKPDPFEHARLNRPDLNKGPVGCLSMITDTGDRSAHV
jgi:hypothetical protein